MRGLGAFAGATLVCGSALAAPPLIRDAAIDVTSLTDERHAFDELRQGAAALRDGDRATAWTAPGGPGATAVLTLDFSVYRPNGGGRVAVLRLDPPSGATLDPGDVVLSVAPDLGPTVTVAPGAQENGSLVFAIEQGRAARVLRLAVRGGVAIAEIDATAATVSADPVVVSAPRGACDELGVTLSWGPLGPSVRGVDVARPAVPVGFSRAAELRDAAVRFDAATRTFTYAITPIGWDGVAGAAQSVTVSCPAALAPPPTGAFLGVVEGFYGRPWTWTERAEIVRSMAAFGLDTYVYAPKDEPLHRASWRTPYDAADGAPEGASPGIAPASPSSRSRGSGRGEKRGSDPFCSGVASQCA